MNPENRSLDRAAGLTIIGCSVVSLAVLSLDQSATASETREIFRQLVALGPAHQAIHAVQMACVTGYAFAFSVLSLRLGLRRAPVLAGLAAFLLGVVMILVAAVNDGFLSVAIATRFAEAPAEDLPIARDLLRFSNMAITWFGDLGFVLMGTASALWAAALAKRGILGRIAALVGLAGGIGTMAAIAVQPDLDLAALLGIVFAEFSFNLLVGGLLLKGLGEDQAVASAAPALSAAR